MHLRVKLQRFMQQTDARSQTDFEKADIHLRQVEQFNISVNLFKETKIGKLIKHMSRMDLPVDEYRLIERCNTLLALWKSQLPSVE
eukprot:jgi/Hompol1/397/HPOL_001328-RA